MKARTYKRLVCLLLTLCFLLSALTACGGSGNDKNANTSDPNTSINSGSHSLGGGNPDTTTPPDPVTTGDGEGDAPAVGADTPTTLPATDPLLVTQVPEGTSGENEPAADPWALMPAPTVESLLASAFPEGKTIHGDVVVSVSASMYIDYDALAEQGWEITENDAAADISPEDMSIMVYLNAHMSQDNDTMYMEGSASYTAFGESDTQESKGYSIKNADGSTTSYTYDSETGAWEKETTVVVSDEGFGFDPILSMGKVDGADLTGLELDTSGDYYVIKGSTTDDLLSSLAGEVGAADSLGLGDDSTTPDMSMTTTLTMYFDKSTREIRSIVVSVEPTVLLFFNISNLTLAIANISFDDADVSVPANIVATATEAPSFDFGDWDE